MREIKFRAWDKQRGAWYEPIHEAYKGNLFTLYVSLRGDLVAHTMQGVEHQSLWPDRFILMQYTGLKDKNGKEIYEGDVLEFTDKWEWYRSAYGIKMAFARGQELEDLQDKYEMEPMHRRVVEFDPYEGYGLGKSDLANYFAVIGNIYENPGLLTPSRD